MTDHPLLRSAYPEETVQRERGHKEKNQSIKLFYAFKDAVPASILAVTSFKLMRHTG